ncbi:ATP-dependent nuclease [Nannocystis pusilla]|uniref:ATP-dependent nuclease n=1 Tax=Nannocystis pusilla TaxID=889268 RepID=UPI003B80536E
MVDYSRISAEDASTLNSALFPNHITRFRSDQGSLADNCWVGENDKTYEQVEDNAFGFYAEAAGLLRSFDAGRYDASWPIDLSKSRGVASKLRNLHKDWLTGSYYLWHRRKSRYKEILGAHHNRLDAEAEHLAARLDHVLSGIEGGRIRTRIDQFMNSVIPDIGDVGIERTKDNDSTEISIVFSDGGAVRSLEDLGGGVEQVLALALVLLAEPDEGGVFIEEPESHLHESAQRRLIKQIEKHRHKRQVFLATHSPIFVNEFPCANVYRLTRDPATKKTNAQPCLSKPEQRQVLDELGVLPSSLTQTNCVIWVEGPTEVRLVTHWLGLVAPELLVNQHYTFAQTGGSNILSLAADLAPGDLKEWLQDIRRICRHNYFICDRDAGVGLDPAKEPVRNIAALVGDDHWVTLGYEIEWYLPDAAVEYLWNASVAEHVRMRRLTADVPFYEHLKASKIRGTASADDRKTAYAERIVNQRLPKETWFAGPTGEDLQTQLEKLVAFIRRANQLEAPSSKTCAACERPLPEHPGSRRNRAGMGLSYSFEFIAPRNGADALLTALADRVDEGYARRLRACLPWSPNTAHRANAGIRGLPPVFDIVNHHDLVVMVPVDPEVRRYFDGYSEPIARHVRDGKAGVGLVYMKLSAGARYIALNLSAASSGMSRLFAGPGSFRKVMASLAAASQARAAFLDVEDDEQWELLHPRPASSFVSPRVSRPPAIQPRRPTSTLTANSRSSSRPCARDPAVFFPRKSFW